MRNGRNRAPGGGRNPLQRGFRAMRGIRKRPRQKRVGGLREIRRMRKRSGKAQARKRRRMRKVGRLRVRTARRIEVLEVQEVPEQEREFRTFQTFQTFQVWIKQVRVLRELRERAVRTMREREICKLRRRGVREGWLQASPALRMRMIRTQAIEIRREGGGRTWGTGSSLQKTPLRCTFPQGSGLLRLSCMLLNPLRGAATGRFFGKKCSGELRRTHRGEWPERATAFSPSTDYHYVFRARPLRRSPYAAVNRSLGSAPDKCNISRNTRELEASGGEGMHMLLQLRRNPFADYGPETQVGLPDRTAAKKRPADGIYPNSFRTSPNEKSLGTSSSPLAV